jgi:hypothetical protein
MKSDSAVSSTFKTDGARRQAVHRTMKILPKDPNKFAEMVSNIIHRSTPKKKSSSQSKVSDFTANKNEVAIL